MKAKCKEFTTKSDDVDKVPWNGLVTFDELADAAILFSSFGFSLRSNVWKFGDEAVKTVNERRTKRGLVPLPKRHDLEGKDQSELRQYSGGPVLAFISSADYKNKLIEKDKERMMKEFIKDTTGRLT